MKNQSSLRVYPGRFIGIRFSYNARMVELLKEAVPLKMWDPLSKTWWFPEDYLDQVEAVAAESQAVSRETFTEFLRMLKPRENRNAYSVLGLLPGTPRGLVDFAYAYWKTQFQQAIGTGSRLAEVEEAYAALTRPEGA
jgi:hypothetical protein